MRIVIESASVRYDPGLPSATTALAEVTLAVERGECVAVIGPTGSGKTTLLEVMAGLTQLDVGAAFLESAQGTDELRSAVGLAYQFPESQFFEETVRADVAFGPEKQGLSEGEVRGRVTDALERSGLGGAGFADRSPLSLSAGEKRRAAIAGILALGRPFLLLDEPTAGLDPSSAETVAELVGGELREGNGVVFVTHDLGFADALATRTVVMGEGSVVADRNTREVLSDTELLSGLGLEPPPRYAVVGWLRELAHPDAERVAGILLGGRP